MNKEIMGKIEAFYLEMETEAIKLGVMEQLNEVMVILGHRQPKEYKNLLDGMRHGWEPKTLDISERIKVYNRVYAVMSTVAKLKLRLDSRRKSGEGEAVDNLKRSGELSDILIELLADECTGKWFEQSNIPKEWVGLQEYSPKFTRSRKRMAFINIKEVFAVPKPIEKIVRAVLES